MFNNTNGWRVEYNGKAIEVCNASDALTVGDLVRNHTNLSKQLIEQATEIERLKTKVNALMSAGDEMTACLDWSDPNTYSFMATWKLAKKGGSL